MYNQGAYSSLRKLVYLCAAAMCVLIPRLALGAPLKVVATTGMIGDLVSAVAPEGTVTLEVLLQPGVDPHLYQPVRSDVAKLFRADLVFYNGLLLEGQMTDTFKSLQNAGKAIAAVTEKLPADQLLHPAEFHGAPDPHIWMDPLAWKEALGIVAKELAARLPASADAIDRRRGEYAARLDALHEYAVKAVASIPESQRTLVTAHDAFRYFGRRYGIEVIGVQGLSTESEAALADIERIVGLIVNRKIPAVFVESTVSERNVRALIEGAAAKGVTVKVGGTLFSDALGPGGSYEGTYLGMIDHNITSIVRALGGNAPERGMQNLLKAGL